MIKQKLVVAWYGGTFDPPHTAHQYIVRYLSQMSDIDNVIVTPTYLNPFKSSTLASPDQRLKWCKVVFDYPKVIIDSAEVEAGESIYTADTLNRLSDRYDIKYIVIGADNLASIEHWHKFDILNKNFTWLVFGREGRKDGLEKLRDFRYIELDNPISASQIRQEKIVDQVDPRIAKEVEQVIKEKNG